MLDRQRKEYEITYVFSLLSTNITFNSQQSMLDINKVMESVLTDLLNKTLHASFVNLNKIKHNHPAIDLGDASTGSAIQITSDGTKAKFEKTIDMFVKHDLHKTYSKVTFLIISNDPKLDFSRKPFSIDVCNLSDLAKEINNLDGDHFDEIYQFCQSNFSIYFPNKNSSMLEPTLLKSVEPSSKLTFFLNANMIDVSEEHIDCTEEDMRNQLIEMKDMLAGMTVDQRWFLFRVINWTLLRYESKYVNQCMVPRSVIFTLVTDSVERHQLKELADSLEHLGLVHYDEHIRDINSDGYYASYSKGIPEEFDYFAGLVTFLRATGLEKNLESIIVDCDFSCIN